MAKESNKKEVKNNNGQEKKFFFKEFKKELKKVVWPTPKQLFNSSIAVISIVLIVGLIVFIFDECFLLMNNKGITKLQEKAKSSFVTSNSTENNTSESNTIDENNTVENITEGNNTVENTDEQTNTNQ